MAGSSKLFVMIVMILAGMLVVGLLVTGGLMIFGSINRAQQAAWPTATATLSAVARVPTQTPTTPAPTVTPSPTNTSLPTNTPSPTATRTPVLRRTATAVAGAQVAGDMSAQGESLSSTPTWTPQPVSESSTPDTGIGGLEAVLIAVGLVGVLFITRRLRTGD